MLTKATIKFSSINFLGYIWVIIFFKYLLVGTSDMLWMGGSVDHGSVDQWEMYVFHTNQVVSTIKQQSNFLVYEKIWCRYSLERP